MYLYQAFNFRMQLISIFQSLSRIYREFVWKALLVSPHVEIEARSLDSVTYKLIALKIKSKTPDRIYFMSQVF